MGSRLFLRDDDVGALTPEFRSFFDLFADAGLPVSYQVIPELFTDECAAYMEARRTRTPALVEYGQHGLRHEMMVRGQLEYYEFGPERTYDQQLQDILEGQALLRRRLGGDIPLQIFTPPRHRYDRNTLKALSAAGFTVLSASSYSGLPHRLAYGAGRALGLTNLGRPGVPWHGRRRPDSGLFELSVAVGVDDGGDILQSVDGVFEGIARAARHTEDVGLLFHHAVYVGPEGRAFLEALVARLKTLPDVSFHTIMDLHERLAGLAA
ncbi:MAG: DUF2334 domain-containing protein [Proteobacteria bacterium]|nr:DUF2334 domain-containing protein [Pseudomonadota bacterium]